MFDTVRFSLGLERPFEDTRGFQFRDEKLDQRTGAILVKYYHNPEKGPDARPAPAITYHETSLRLVAQVSLPKIVNGQNVDLITEADLPRAYSLVHEYLCEIVRAVLPPMSEWGVSRLDYCYCWQVGDDIGHYLAGLDSLRLSRYKRVPFEAEDGRVMEGICWKSRGRKVNFYDKGLETGLPEAQGILRYELQNLDRRSVDYLARKRFNCPRTAEALLTDERALTELRVFVERLGVTGPFRSEATVLRELNARYGRRKAKELWYFLGLERTYGKTAVKAGLIGKRTYERHKSEARRKGYLTMTPANDLPPLVI